MEFFFSEEKMRENIVDLGRKIGYFLIGRGKNEAEFSFIRPLQRGGYPRFHLIVRTDKGKQISFNLHLDQKRSVYKGSVAHSGEYHGPVIEQESERIKKLINHD